MPPRRLWSQRAYQTRQHDWDAKLAPLATDGRVTFGPEDRHSASDHAFNEAVRRACRARGYHRVHVFWLPRRDGQLDVLVALDGAE